MKYEVFLQVLSSLDNIDRGKPAPRLSNEIGAFFRSYGLRRNDFTKLAIRQAIDVNRNGEIPGDAIGPVSLIPLTSLAPPQSVTTHYGGFFSIPVICPELLSIIDLRLWTDSGSGSAGLNLLESLMENEGGLILKGGFRWTPPIRITAGTGSPTALPRMDNDPWTTFAFLKYAGEDVTSDPFPLEYRPLWIGGDPLLAAIRVTAGVVKEKGKLVVPHAMSNSSTTIRLVQGSCTTARARTVLSQEGGCTCLLIREPDNDTWTIWDAVESGAEDLLTHLVSWAEYVDRLRESPIWGNRDSVVGAALSSLSLVDVESRHPLKLPCSSFPVYEFAQTLARHMRWGTGTSLEPVGYVE